MRNSPIPARPKFLRILLLGSVTLTTVQTALGYCECGYSLNATSSPAYQVFTDLLETDFLHLSNITLDTDWVAQNYTVDSSAARGPYGKWAQVENIIANPLDDNGSFTGPSRLGGDPGLQLWVRSGTNLGQMIPMAEAVTARTDMLYGTYRAAMKLTGVNGTCGAFFWYLNNSQEIDMEFLSRELNATSSPINLVLQSEAAEEAGFDASKTPTFSLHQLPFQPDEGYHEYRFDWTADRVSFYADGQWLDDMTTAVPTAAGAIHLIHWSNGDPGWSAGPPGVDAVMTVSYVKAYFNSSSTSRQEDYRLRCKDSQTPQAICTIPDQTIAPNPLEPNGNQTANTFFFTHERNMTVNQTFYGADHHSAGSQTVELALKTFVTVMVVGHLIIYGWAYDAMQWMMLPVMFLRGGIQGRFMERGMFRHA